MANHHQDQQSLHQQHARVCAELNMDKAAGDEAWQTFQRIGRNYTLEGEKLHWLACALYVSCRKALTPTAERGNYIEGNCVSLTRLLKSCELSLVQFFDKMKKWSDMANLPHDMRTKIDQHERNFNVSCVIFKKFKPIFLEIFKDPALSPTKPAKNRKQSRKQPITTHDVFSFCWTLFVHVKANFPAISNDLVNSFHLLIACIDFCYSNALVAENGKDLLNPQFSELPSDFSSDDFKAPEEACCIVQALCKKWEGIFVDAKGIKEHWWRPHIKRMVERRLLKSRSLSQQPQALLGLFDSSNYEFNLNTINKEYEEHVLTIGDFDERIFLSDNAQKELGTPHISSEELAQRMELKQRIEDTKTTWIPQTPLSNRQYLLNKEVGTATPVSSATHNVGQLHSLLLDRKAEPSSALLEIYRECSTNPQEFIEKLLKDMGELFVKAYNKPNDDCVGEMPAVPAMHHDDFARKRLELGRILYFKCLDNIIAREKKKLASKNGEKSSEALTGLLFQETMHLSLFACSMEIILFSYNSERTFPWIIDVLAQQNPSFQPFHFYKVIELIIRDEDGLSRSVVKHLSSLEEQILGSMAWRSESALWDAIKVQGAVPSCQDVALPTVGGDTKASVLASPMAAVKKISRDVFASPSSSASERFGTITTAAKRKLFDGEGAQTANQQPHIVTLQLPTQTMHGEVRYIQIPAVALAMPPAANETTKMEPPRPKNVGSLGLFFRKVYNLAWIRLRDLCDRLNITDDDLKRKVWTCFELSLKSHTELMRDRHIDQLMMCAIYAMCKVSKHDISFQDIMKCYRLQPQAKSHIYRSVLLTNRSRRSSDSSDNSRPSSSPVSNGGIEEKASIRSSSTLPIPHPSSQPPTPTRLAGTGSQFDFGEERGDLIMFYNQVFVPEMKSYILKFNNPTDSSSSPILSPLPRLAQNPVSPCRRVSQQHKLFISPMKAPSFPPSPKRPLSYSFLRSPAKELRAINQMMKASSERRTGVSKRILQDDGCESENSPAAKRLATDPTLFRSKIQNIFTERQGSVSDDIIENGDSTPN